MGIPVLIIGESGSGKTTSLRHLSPDQTLIMGVTGKLLPFKNKIPYVKNISYEGIWEQLKKKDKKIYVIDDSQYLLAFELFARAKEQGYGKFTDIAIRFKKMLDYINKLPDNIRVYLLHHSETTDLGKTKAKTVGKMLDSQLTLEGLFNIVLHATTLDGKYIFETTNASNTTAKAPLEMLPEVVENDLKLIDDEICKYWGL